MFLQTLLFIARAAHEFRRWSNLPREHRVTIPWHCERGETLVEYSLVSVICSFMLLAIVGTGDSAAHSFQSVGLAISGVESLSDGDSGGSGGEPALPVCGGGTEGSTRGPGTRRSTEATNPTHCRPA